MLTLERQIQKVRPGKWAELEAINKKFNEIEEGFGFPPKKRYQCIFGGHDTNILIVERQWESMAKMEEVYEKALADEKYQALGQEVETIIKSNQIEIYMPLP